jgi:hypothetical protein
MTSGGKKKLNKLPSFLLAMVSSFIVLCPQVSWGTNPVLAFQAFKTGSE